MKQLNRIIIFIVIFIVMLMPINILLAKDIEKIDYNPDSITTNSPSAILMEPKTNKILYSKNAYSRMYPASTTKLMTAILTLENCELDDVATVSHNAIYSIPAGYSHASLQEGENLTIEQLLNVLLIPSANDAAVVLAEHISGSVEEFVNLMNEKAKEIGCLDTHFVNPNGIHDENHYSTAYDLALIGSYAMKFDDIMRISKLSQYTLPKTNKYYDTDRIFNTTNSLVNKNEEDYYKNATGLKTGYTDAAGSCIVSTAKKDNVELIEVVLGSESSSERFQDCTKLFEYGFTNYSYKNLITKNKIIDTIKIDGATQDTKSLNILAKNDLNVLVKNSNIIENITPNIDIKDDLKAPIAQNAVVGTISYTVDDETYTIDLIAQNDVKESDFETIIFRALLIFLILYLLVIILRKINKPKRYRRYNNIKHSSKSKVKSKKGGRYKYTQINEYL